MSLSEDPILRVQTALERRVAVYALKRRLSNPLDDDDSNKFDRYTFALECFEIFAREAGLEIPPDCLVDDDEPESAGA